MKLNHTKGKVLLVCFLCVDTLLFASKHAKGMSLRYDTIFALSDNLFFMFLFQSPPSIYPLSHKNLYANINNVRGEIYCKMV